MAKKKRQFVCDSCGHTEPKWLGKCPGCENWSTLIEQEPLSHKDLGVARRTDLATAVVLNSVQSGNAAERMSTGIAEFDRVLGGGLVRGALVLVGGDPGIGKSTLLLQAMGLLAEHHRVIYLSAEESLHQVRMRAERLGKTPDNLLAIADTKLESLEAAIKTHRPTVCVVDSIQTIGTGELSGTIGSVGQIRAVTNGLMDIAKRQDISIFVVGHVTKEGTIAGPKVMEHMVDTVLYFEGERTGPYRILRAHKNRFGSAQEIGVFEMTEAGLIPVDNPSELFLSQRAQGPGSVVITSVEGSRPLLLEVQALTTASPYGTPRRTTIGIDSQRVAMLCAVLSARAGYELSNLDVYVNMAGGVRISEPAGDLGVMMALASGIRAESIDENVVAIGEVGLSGEVRAVSQLGLRLQEAQSLGFRKAVVPQTDLLRHKDLHAEHPHIQLCGARHVQEALDVIGLA